jgi:hypothetical protein
MNRLRLCLTLVCVMAMTSFASAQTYNIYFGDNHSHTWYSDGNQDQNEATYTLPVARSITWARTNRSSMDFLGISDHNHNEGGLNMTLAYWRSGFREADSVNQDGTFVGMYGQEWGVISGGGHVLVYGTTKLFGWDAGVYDVYIPKSNYSLLWDSVKKYNGYCYLAHPQSGDFGGIFTGTYNAKADSVIRGIAMRSGPATSTNTSETNPAGSTYQSRFHDLLQRGYHVAPIENQDNHNTTFGRVNQQRTGVLATSLTKANIDDAYRNRHVYATDDHNLQLRFEVGTHIMGDIFTTSGAVPLHVSAYDPDGESITHIEIRSGIPGSGIAPTTLTSVNNAAVLDYSQPQTIGTTYYYYAYVTEADGHAAWSAPMWITITANPAPSAFALLTPSNGAISRPLSGSLVWNKASGATTYDVYFGTANPPTTKVGADQTDTTFLYSGLTNGTTYYWKVTAKNANGSTDATGSPWSFTTLLLPPGAFALTSPATGSTGQPIAGTLSWQTSSNATGYDVYLGTVNPPVTKVSTAQAGTTYSYSSLLNSSVYYWKVVAKNTSDSAVATGAPWNFTTIIAAPSAFTVSSPASGSTGRPISGTLAWHPSAGAASYDVYLGTANPPVTKISADQTDTVYSYSGLTNAVTYYWQVVAKNAGGTTNGTSSPWNFTTIVLPPAGFALLSPADSAVNQPLGGSLSWQASSGATGYDVYLGTTTPPVTRVSTNQAGTTYAYSGLDGSTQYFWKIVARNSADTTVATGSPWSFTTSIPPPAAFGHLSPVSGTTLLPLNGQLAWHSASGAAAYDVYLGTTNPPTTVVSADQTDTTFSYSALANNTTYYWIVVAKNIGGSVNGTGSPWNFTTLPLPPGSFSPTAPANSASGLPLSGMLSWQASPHATEYDVYLDEANPPVTKVSSAQAGTTYNYSVTGLGATYYWKVVAKNPVDSIVSAGAPWQFTTALSGPLAFSLVSPGAGAAGILPDGSPLVWTSSVYTVGYDLYLDQANPPVTKVVSDSPDTVYVCHGLTPGATYYWSVVAKNNVGSLEASGAPRHFTVESVPVSPSAPSVLDAGTGSFVIGWTDAAANETGYRVYRALDSAGPYVSLGADLPANTVSITDSLLSINTRYYYRITAFNVLGESGPASLAAATLAVIPGRPALTGVTFRSASFVLDPAANPPATEFSVTAYIDEVPSGYLHADGSIGVAGEWHSADEWGGVQGVALQKVLACHENSFRVRARNLAGVETADGPVLTQAIPCFTSTQYHTVGWNLVSLPVAGLDVPVADLFPTGNVTAFGYDGRYVPLQTLRNGRGYWLKFATADSIQVSGPPIDADTIQLVQGWNLVGSVSTPVNVTAVLQVPDAITSSNYFTFNGSGYQKADIIEPMKGYWVKSRSAGSLILTSSFGVAAKAVPVHPSVESVHYGMVTVEDNTGHRQTLLLDPVAADQKTAVTAELPPVPPEGAFDARFASQMSAGQVAAGTGFRNAVLLQGASYPVTLKWTITDETHRYACQTGSGSVAMTGAGSAVLRTEADHAVISAVPRSTPAQPTQFVLDQNYPNPFNPSTTIRFGLPASADVTVTISNVLGETVDVLMSRQALPTGWNEVSWNAVNAASGIYYVRVTSERSDGSGSDVAVRRMMLLK